MDAKTAALAALAFAAIFALAAPSLDHAAASPPEDRDAAVDGEAHGGGSDGGTCPFKDRKTASYQAVPGA